MFPLEKKIITLNDKKMDLLFTETDLKHAAKTLGEQINKYYNVIKAKEPIIMISILEESVMFFTDLQKNFTFRMIPEFILKRDIFQQNFEEINLDKLHFEILKEKHVLLVSSSLDQKLILPFIVNKISSIGPESLQVAILICDPEMKCNLNTSNTYTAFSHSSNELIGYGFGRQEKLGSLPQIYKRTYVKKPL